MFIIFAVEPKQNTASTGALLTSRVQRSALRDALRPMFARRLKPLGGSLKRQLAMFDALLGEEAAQYHQATPTGLTGFMYDLIRVHAFLADEFSETDAVAMRIALANHIWKIVAFEYKGNLTDFYERGMAAEMVSYPPRKIRERLAERFLEQIGKRVT